MRPGYDSQAGDREAIPNLASQATAAAHLWPTLSATPYGSSQNGSNSTRPSAGTPSLENQARDLTTLKLWPTPRASDWKSGEVSDAVFESNARPLTEQVTRWPGVDSSALGGRHLGVAPFPPGPDDADGWREYLSTYGADFAPALAADNAKGSLMLSPRFVETLLNWPVNWTIAHAGATSDFEIDPRLDRVDRLRMLGNGVVVAQARVAILALWRRAFGSASADVDAAVQSDTLPTAESAAIESSEP